MLELAVIPGSVTRGRRKPLHETLPERLKRLRSEQQIAREPLSLRAGLSGTTVRAIEADGRTPGIDTAERIARALGVSPCYFAYGVEGAALPPREEEGALRSMSCGERLAQLREACGMSARALGTAAGIAGPTVSAIEHGENLPSVATAEVLAAALGCSPCWLAYAEGPSPLDDPAGAAVEFEAVKFRPPRSPRKAGA